MNDPLMQHLPALLELPVLSGRQWAEDYGSRLIQDGIAIATQAVDEPDGRCQAQLAATAQAIRACAVNLFAYARGKVPRVGRAEPSNRIICSN